jgi:hypothetical protein
MNRGRPRVEEKAKFRNVAVPMEIYDMIRDVAKEDDRTIARQLAVLIKEAHEARFGVQDS